MQRKGEVVAITFTHVRHKRHMLYLTSAPNLRGQLTPPPRLGLDEPLHRWWWLYTVVGVNSWTAGFMPPNRLAPVTVRPGEVSK